MRIVRGAPGLAPGAEVELASDELPMPAQQRVGRDNRAQVEQNLAGNAKPFARQRCTFIVREPNSTSLESPAQHPIPDVPVIQTLTADPTSDQEI